MYKLVLMLCCIFIGQTLLFSQQITSEQLLEKAIAYHDPNGNWLILVATSK